MKTSPLEKKLGNQIQLAGLPVPRREFHFAKALGRQFRSDFAWPEPEFKLLVEVDGGSWSGGRHTTGKGFQQDCIKLNLATLLGYRVLRFTSKEVRKGTALNQIDQALRGGIKVPEQGNLLSAQLGLRALGLGA